MRLSLAITACLLLAACGPRLSPQMQASKEKNMALNAQVTASQTVSYGGNDFAIGQHPSEPFVLVTPKTKGAKVTEAFLEAAATQVSGCKADFDAGILTFIEGYTDQSPIPLNQPMRVNLAC